MAAWSVSQLNTSGCRRHSRKADPFAWPTVFVSVVHDQFHFLCVPVEAQKSALTSIIQSIRDLERQVNRQIVKVLTALGG
jgi:hypothetical protein